MSEEVYILRENGCLATGKNYRLCRNPNYEDPAKANIFLERSHSGFWHEGYECIGGAEKKVCGEYTGRWVVTVDAPYDPENDSDARFVGDYATQEEAINALWHERYEIWR